MLRILTASSLLALASASAMAQTGPMDPPNAPHSPTSVQPATPATSATPAEPSGQVPRSETQPVAESPPAPTSEPKEVTVQKLVDAEFPTYDVNKDNELEPTEFRKWILALHDAASAANAAKDPAVKAKWANAAFTTADTDKSKKVSKAEMNAFLLG